MNKKKPGMCSALMCYNWLFPGQKKYCSKACYQSAQRVRRDKQKLEESMKKKATKPGQATPKNGVLYAVYFPVGGADPSQFLRDDAPVVVGATLSEALAKVAQHDIHHDVEPGDSIFVVEIHPENITEHVLVNRFEPKK